MSKTNEEKMLELLAFGKVNDTVRLLTEMQKDKPDLSALDKLELRNIRTIRYTSAGGFEVEFYDRFRAMLALNEGRKAEGAPALYSAIENAASAFRNEQDGADREYLSRHE